MWLRALLFAVLVAVSGVTARAEEYIKSFRTEIEIARSGQVNVTETIAIVSEGKEFKYGILRNFPLGYMTSDGLQPAQLEILGVTRDGAPEEHNRDLMGDGTRVYIGTRDRLLADGEHIYRITYHIDNQIRPAGENDMFAWDVTGRWPFRIEHAEAIVTLPNGTKVLGTQQNAGTPGTSHDNARVTVEGSKLVFGSVLPVQPGGALQFTILFPKNSIARPH
jgi:hypothetical protein